MTAKTKHCAECARIKRARSEAAKAGDIKRSMALTTLMGVHLRQAHP